MTFRKIIPTLLFTFSLLSTFAQETGEDNTKRGYISAEGEMIFSFANIESPEGVNIDQNMRWSPVFNLAWHYNYDVSKNFGLNIGLGVRNVGFIAKGNYFANDENDIDRVKFRTYNAGVPVGFKLGDLDQEKPFFLFAGYEFEVPLHYKEKQFDGNNKDEKITSWFSNKTPDYVQSVFAGIQFPQGMSLKFKYYLTEFFDPDYTETIEAEGGDSTFKPFEDFNANVFYISIEWFPFQDVKYAMDMN
jgi:hypothetical protein